jgi:flagellar hook-associated protein 1 FlgK
VVLQRGSAVAAQLRFVSSGISQRWQSARAELDTTIDQLNRAATDLAGVNQAILEGKVADRPVNELLDRRDLLVRQIGDLVGGRSVESQDGTVSVVVNGITAVSGSHAETFTLTGAGTIEDATSNPPQISLGPHPMPVTSGRAAGLLAVTSTDLPNLTIQLDNVALALRDVVNGQHTAGFTLAGAGGGDFFDATGAADISVVPTSADQLAVAGATGVVDGANALAIADLAQDALARAALGAPGPSEEWRVLTAGLGSQLQGLNRAGDVQESVLSSADAAVNADAGVNLDEEMAALLMYQRSYQASARVLTAVDEMLDTLVNRTGTIGR